MRAANAPAAMLSRIASPARRRAPRYHLHRALRSVWRLQPAVNPDKPSCDAVFALAAVQRTASAGHSPACSCVLRVGSRHKSRDPQLKAAVQERMLQPADADIVGCLLCYISNHPFPAADQPLQPELPARAQFDGSAARVAPRKQASTPGGLPCGSIRAQCKPNPSAALAGSTPVLSTGVCSHMLPFCGSCRECERSHGRFELRFGQP